MWSSAFLVFCMLFICRLSAENDDRYSYDSKLLDKLIRLEVKVEEMEKKLEISQTKMETFITDQTKIIENKTAEMEVVRGK